MPPKAHLKLHPRGYSTPRRLVWKQFVRESGRLRDYPEHLVWNRSDSSARRRACQSPYGNRVHMHHDILPAIILTKSPVIANPWRLYQVEFGGWRRLSPVSFTRAGNRPRNGKTVALVMHSRGQVGESMP